MNDLVPIGPRALLDPDEIECIKAKARKGTVAALSREREEGPFLLFCCGDDLHTIATKTGFPVDVIYMTAESYEWERKAAAIRSETGNFDPIKIQKELSKNLLIATHMAVQAQLKDVLAGRKSAAECPLIPKNIMALKQLMEMVSSLQNPEEKGSNSTVVHAQNVQINNTQVLPELSDIELEIRRLEREAKFKKLRGEV